MISRVILIVMDSVGIGALPDADKFGDAGSNTIGNIARNFPGFKIPNLVKLGLGNIDAELKIGNEENTIGCFGKAMEVSPGKDTTTGHWEIAGLILEKPFPTYPDGFPEKIILEFEKKIETKTLANKVASGTEIINEFGAEHQATGFPIVYTSADSVFQIAMHEEVIPIERQYQICEIARKIMKNEHEVARVIARPFAGNPGSYKRTSNRKDFSIFPPGHTVLNHIKASKMEVMAVGKINDIFTGYGITQYVKTKDNMEGMDKTLEYMRTENKGIIFTNLVDFDMNYGHRRDVSGYAKSLMEFDARIPELLDNLKSDDVLIITADHGNDPTFRGSDHTREYIPILVYSHTFQKGKNIGTRKTFADIGATISEMLQTGSTGFGKSFYDEIKG